MENRKKMLVLTATFPRWENDDMPDFVLRFAQEMARHYEVHVLAPHYKNAKQEEVVHNVRVFRFRYFFQFGETLAYGSGMSPNIKKRPWLFFLLPIFLFAQILKTATLLRKNHYHILNAHWAIPQGLSASAAKALANSSVPLVCTVHGSDIFAWNSLFTRGIKRHVLRKSQKVITVSQALAQKVVSIGAEAKNVSVIPMGIDFAESCSSVIPDRDIPLFFAGRLTEQKGVLCLLEAFRRIAANHPEIKLVIAGDGPQKQSIEKFLEKNNIRQKVTMLGRVRRADLFELYCRAQVTVVPSLGYEGFGLVAAEAMGCGSAVAASDLAGLRDIVRNSETGVLFKAGDTDSMVRGISRLLDRPFERERLGESGRSYARAHYSWAIIGQKYKKVFDDLFIQNRKQYE